MGTGARATAVVMMLVLAGCSKKAPVEARPAEIGSNSAPRPAPPVAGHIRLRLMPRIRTQVEALPRVVANDAVSEDVARRMNARFDKLDADARGTARDCRNNDGTAGDYERTLEVTMRGPRYLSLVADDSYDCGGAHPDGASVGLVYDTTDGSPVDWLRLLPGTKAGYPDRDASGMLWLKWPVLQAEALSQAEDDCKDVYRDKDLQFILWLEGDKGAVAAKPAGLAHINDALCSVTVELGIDRLKALGAAKELVEALQAARH